MPRIALIGDYDPSVIAHQAIPPALELSARSLGINVEPVWVHTSTLIDPVAEKLADFDAVWCVPASPYANTDGALAAIRYARESGTPFLGTCGGFQHAVIEYARNVLGHTTADHAETSPDASILVISKLTCSLVEKTGTVHFTAGSRLRNIYGADRANEGYHCNYGLNPQFATLFTDPKGMQIAARDDAGDVRAVELAGQPFFIATLFQPERSAKKSLVHPLITAFLHSAK